MSGFDYEKVKEPKFFAENRMDAHSDHECFRSWDEMQQEKNSNRISLDGIWKFYYAKNYKQCIKGFEAADYDCRPWDDIRVPAHIQMEGYDSPLYANLQYPWDGREDIWRDEIPTEFNPTANYVKYFTLPEGFLKNGIYISFQGVESGFAVWLNGQYVGYSEDSFTPSEFELTPYLKEGENKLAVQVFKWTASSWCEDQDFFRFSGIFRSVYLYTVPTTHLYDVKIEPLVEESLKEAVLNITMQFWGTGSVKLTLKDGLETIFEERAQVEGWKFPQEENAGKGINVSEFSKKVENPKLWSAETPYLYDVLLEIYDSDGVLQEVVSEHVGFRRFEMKNGIMRLNGKRIVFKGVNRHEFSSKTGRVVSKEELVQDIVTMKRNNINAIRTCHYPDDSLIYRLCDEYGLYMIAENNLESHGSWDAGVRNVRPMEMIVPGDNLDWEAMMLDRVNSCYQRDKNHPAILIWSCGNESYGGKVIFDMAEKFRKLDKHRLVHYEGVFHDRRYDNTSGGLFEDVPVGLEKDEYSATITYTYYMPTTPASKCQVAYTVYGDGTIQTKLTYDPVEGLPDMPEFGMLFKLNADYDNVEWYGMGASETYADRKHGAKLGIYKNKVADNMAKYLVPQECGNKVGVRYAKVTDYRGRGMIFEGDELSFSVLPYTPHEVENAMHSYELPPVHYTVVRVAAAQMGVGGDDSWGALVHPEYHIDTTKPLELCFRFREI